MNILISMGEIAGIGGLGLGVFLLLCKQIVTTIKWQTPTKEQAYRLLNRMIVLAFCLAVAGIAAFILSLVVDHLANILNGPASIQAGSSSIINLDAHTSPEATRRTDAGCASLGIELVTIHVDSKNELLSDPDANAAISVLSALCHGEHVSKADLLRKMADSDNGSGNPRREQDALKRVLERDGIRVRGRVFHLEIGNGQYFLSPSPLDLPSTSPAAAGGDVND